MELWRDTLKPMETCLNTSHSPSITLYYASCNISSQLPYFTSKSCQHWGNRTGKSHHSTMILKYQNLFHLVKIISLPNKANANTVKYARLWVILKEDSWGASNSLWNWLGILLLLWPLHAPPVYRMEGAAKVKMKWSACFYAFGLLWFYSHRFFLRLLLQGECYVLFIPKLPKLNQMSHI